MKWLSYKKRKAQIDAELKEWHNWFAWHPVTSDTEEITMWLETVERRLLYTYGWETEHRVWEYRVIEKSKQDKFDYPQDYMG